MELTGKELRATRKAMGVSGDFSMKQIYLESTGREGGLTTLKKFVGEIRGGILMEKGVFLEKEQGTNSRKKGPF